MGKAGSKEEEWKLVGGIFNQLDQKLQNIRTLAPKLQGRWSTLDKKILQVCYYSDKMRVAACPRRQRMNDEERKGFWDHVKVAFSLERKLKRLLTTFKEAIPKLELSENVSLTTFLRYARSIDLQMNQVSPFNSEERPTTCRRQSPPPCESTFLEMPSQSKLKRPLACEFTSTETDSQNNLKRLKTGQMIGIGSDIVPPVATLDTVVQVKPELNSTLEAIPSYKCMDHGKDCLPGQQVIGFGATNKLSYIGIFNISPSGHFESSSKLSMFGFQPLAGKFSEQERLVAPTGKRSTEDEWKKIWDINIQLDQSLQYLKALAPNLQDTSTNMVDRILLSCYYSDNMRYAAAYGHQQLMDNEDCRQLKKDVKAALVLEKKLSRLLASFNKAVPQYERQKDQSLAMFLSLADNINREIFYIRSLITLVKQQPTPSTRRRKRNTSGNGAMGGGSGLTFAEMWLQYSQNTLGQTSQIKEEDHQYDHSYNGIALKSEIVAPNAPDSSHGVLARNNNSPAINLRDCGVCLPGISNTKMESHITFGQTQIKQEDHQYDGIVHKSEIVAPNVSDHNCVLAGNNDSPTVNVRDGGGRLHCNESDAACLEAKNDLIPLLDGLKSEPGKQVLVLASTNRPCQLDEAINKPQLDEAINKPFEQRIVVDLPCEESRKYILRMVTGEENVEGIELKEVAIVIGGHT